MLVVEIRVLVVEIRECWWWKSEDVIGGNKRVLVVDIRVWLWWKLEC